MGLYSLIAWDSTGLHQRNTDLYTSRLMKYLVYLENTLSIYREYTDILYTQDK